MFFFLIFLFLRFTYIRLLVFLHEINLFDTKILKLRLDDTHVIKLNSI